jgi:exopolysaccharide biosynthesis polyprenyl glycosylphosphotransferase
MSLAKEIKATPYLGIRAIGFLDDIKTGDMGGFRILGNVGELEQVVTKYYIDEIYITIPSERKVSADILQKGADMGKTVRVVAENFGMPHKQIRLNYVGSIPLVIYNEKPAHGADGVAKRIMDIVISGVSLVFLSPLFILIAIFIKIESPGPVIYVSRRGGKKGVAFNLYKFRTMIKDADIVKDNLKERSVVKDGPIFKIPDDPRLTNVGKFLRRYSLDEMPQLINVLKGEMSLVGPRPFPVEENDRIEHKHIPRLNIKPGMTGLAQVKGRSNLLFSHWMRWDTWYLHNWSLGLDFKVLLWTVPAVFKGKGAY